MQINALMSTYASFAPRVLGATGRAAQTENIVSAKPANSPRPPISDSVSFSAEALAQIDKAEARHTTASGTTAPAPQTRVPQKSPPPPATDHASTNATGDTELTAEEQEQIDALKSRDREVRQHEQAHVAAAGSYVTGGPTYSYQRGPDGKRYAVGGEVNIDTSPIDGDPEATAQKARVVRAAALAPAEPSSQDLRVAASATKMEQEAIAQLRQSNSHSPNAADSASNRYGVQAPERAQFLDVIA